MRITNTFRNLCKELTEKYTGTENKYAYVKKFLLKSYGKDSDALLKIKADAMQNQNNTYESNQVAVLALVFSAVGTAYSMLPKINDNLSVSVIALIYLIVMAFSTIKIGFDGKCKEIRIWREYILLAVDEIIANME